MASSSIFDGGTTVHGTTDAEPVRNAGPHTRKAHPGLSGQLSRQEISAMDLETADGSGPEPSTAELHPPRRAGSRHP